MAQQNIDPRQYSKCCYAGKDPREQLALTYGILQGERFRPSAPQDRFVFQQHLRHTFGDILDNFANVSNAELFLQAATAGMEDVSSFNIPAIDLTEPRNSVTTGGIWGLVLIVVIPVGLLACGFVRWLRRRKM